MNEIIKAIQTLGRRDAEGIARTQLFVQRHEDAPAVMAGVTDPWTATRRRHRLYCNPA
jgi:hypothetical protein